MEVIISLPLFVNINEKSKLREFTYNSTEKNGKCKFIFSLNPCKSKCVLPVIQVAVKKQLWY